MDQVFQAFHDHAIHNIPYKETKEVVLRWKKLLTSMADFSNEVLCYIAKGYEEDPRFKDYFEKYKNEI